MLNVGRAIRWDSALGVGRHKVSDYVTTVGTSWHGLSTAALSAPRRPESASLEWDNLLAGL